MDKATPKGAYKTGLYFPNYWEGPIATSGSVARPKGTSSAVQRSLCDVTKTSTPVTKALSNLTILSYQDADASALPSFTSKAFFVAGKGRFGFTKIVIGPKKCEGPRNF